MQLANLSKQRRHLGDGDILHVVAIEIRIESEIGIVTDAGRKVTCLVEGIDHKRKLLAIRRTRREFANRLGNGLSELRRMQGAGRTGLGIRKPLEHLIY